jgi:YbbR domain-containing protein
VRKRIGRLNIPLLVISMLLSLTLWIVVQAQSMQITSWKIFVPLKIANLDPRYVIANNVPDSVQITIEGPGDKRDDPGLKSAQAIVDLRSATPGRRTYNAIVEAPDPEVGTMLPKDTSKITFDVEAKQFKTFKVVVEPKGRISDRSLRYAQSEVDPETVVYSGPADRVDSIARVRVMLDLGELEPNNAEKTFDLPVDALDVRGRIVRNVVPSVSLVNIHPTVEPASVDKQLFIIPNLIGRPAAGYEVIGYKAQPDKLSVTGSSLLLAESSSVSTEPIDLTGLTKTATFDAKLQMPGGLTVVEPRPIKVRVEVRRQSLPSSNPARVPSKSTDPPFPDRVPPIQPEKGISH